MSDSDSILLVDDHPLFRNGLKSLIHGEIPDALIREVGSLSEARLELENEVFSDIILDVTLPDGDGVSFSREILEMMPVCRIFILSMHRRSGFILRARDIGCRGYFLKEGDGSELLVALKADAGLFCVSSQLKDLLVSTEHERGKGLLYAELTRREKEVFKLFAEGLGYKEVAWKLGISPRTASVHRYNIFNKLEIISDVELVKAAQEVGLSL